MIEELLVFTQKAGKIILKQRNNIKPLKHKDNTVESVVTQTDETISDLFEKFIKKQFSNLDYIIIDEEKISKYGKDIFKYVENSDYQFVIDPIDGTLQYANGHPLYGLSIGVFKKAQPLMGIIYLPEINELIYCDDRKAYYVQKAFTKKEQKNEIKKQNKSSSSIIFGHTWIWDLTDEFSIQNTVLIDYYSAVSQCLYTLVGKAKGYAMYLHLWDIAGAIPIAEKVGMKIFEYGSEKIYNKISPFYFTTEMWTKKPCILCHQEDYKNIHSIIKSKI